MFNLFTKKNGNWRDDTLSGLTVALALVPEAIAFAFIAGLEPLYGLYAAFFVGFVTATTGGRPGMISGATGAIAVVLKEMGEKLEHSDFEVDFAELVFATVAIAGVIQILIGLFKLGRFIRLVPHPVMMGFVNGLAIVILLGQVNLFKVWQDGSPGSWLAGGAMGTMLGLVALTMAIIHFLPKFTKAVPSSLVAIIVVSAVVFLGADTQKVVNLSSVAGAFPLPHLPQVPWSWELFQFVLPYAIIVALVGVIESLMTMQLIDELTETRGQGNRECIAQGAANLTCGFFKGMGGCAMIGQSLINIKSGGRGRTSGIVASLALLAFVLLLAPLIDQIPIAALVGVMFMVVIGTFEWSTFNTFGKVPKADIAVIAVVTAVTVWKDLALAVIVGVILSALVFAWQSAKHVRLFPQDRDDGSRLFSLQGLLYFGSVREFSERLAPANQPDEVTIDFLHARVCDHSSLEAINALAKRYAEVGKRLRLRHLSPECRAMLDKSGDLCEIEIEDDDPHYTVARI